MNKGNLLSHGSLLAKTEYIDDVVSILISASRICRSKFACHLYAVCRDPEENGRIWITEIWDSQLEMDRALKDPDILELISTAIPMLAENPKRGQRLTIVTE